MIKTLPKRVIVAADHHDAPATDRRGLEPQKVLIVDDVALNREFVAAELEPLYLLLQACDAEQAWQLACAELPDLILLDVRLPSMNGFELCQKLKQEPQTKHIAIIFLTALHSTADEEIGLNMGAVDFIRKPFTPTILRARVRNHLLLQQQRKQLTQWSWLDGLTGVANRRRFDQDLARQWQQAQLAGRPIGLLLLDIDYFKAFNDHYGHQLGDAALRQVAMALQEAVQPLRHLLARYGGEEFVCLAVDCTKAELKALAEHLCTVIRGLAISHLGSPLCEYLTISIGGASLQPEQGCAPESLLALADQRLYQAKRLGRDRSVI